MYTQAPSKPKCSTDMMQCNCRAEHKKCGNSFPHYAQGPSFTLYNLESDTLMAHESRATELVHRLWEKDKCPAESIEIGAPVFITLVYRLNSHLLSPSAKCPLDLLFSCLHMKQFIKNEWEESKILTAVRWEGAMYRKRKWKRTVVGKQVKIIWL